MRLDFAFICEHARVVGTCQDNVEIDALGIARTLTVPVIPYTYDRFYFVAGALGAANELRQGVELRLVGPDGKDVIKPLRCHPTGGAMAAKGTIVAPLTDVAFHKVGTHQVLFAVGGTELARVSFEVAIARDCG
jgi:hypothetical protein